VRHAELARAGKRKTEKRRITIHLGWFGIRYAT